MRPTKRDELVHRATDIFYRNGFQASGMDMLVAETGISKTSIYKHFRTKEDLILATLQWRDEHIRGWLFRRMKELGSTPREQLIAMFDALGEWFSEPTFRGCMFAKATSEYQDADHPINRQAAGHVEKLTDGIRELAEQAGLPDPATLARQLTLLKEGAVVLAMLGHTSSPARDAKAVAVRLLSDPEAPG
ncbi:MAG: TetR family transcriptional regulator [Caulobacter sp.]|nr:TetR family transcriptional regulator [Caulobacter sp.]